MRCTGDPHLGHGSPNFPCTAMSCRNAVTFFGQSSSVSDQSLSIHVFNESTTARWRTTTSPSDSCPVLLTGDIWACHRISSEQALPIPENIRGSVRARFRVRFSDLRASENSFVETSNGSPPPQSKTFTSSQPETIQIPARPFVPYSVRINEPWAKSTAARPTFLGMPSLADPTPDVRQS
jgi:hypothetical protein